MDHLTTIDAILAFAIGEEEKAAALYEDLAKRADQPHLKRAFEEFSQEERRHKQILLEVKQGGGLQPIEGQIPDLGLAEMMRPVDAAPGLDYQQILIFAMQREKEAFLMYTRLADHAPSESLRRTLQALAQEEARHKLRIETEYDQTIMTEG